MNPFRLQEVKPRPASIPLHPSFSPVTVEQALANQARCVRMVQAIRWGHRNLAGSTTPHVLERVLMRGKKFD
ncbi:MAG TPA: hypothetical protein VHF69_03360 [Candidatus Synoicihabitans sp.]|nr:hypothetical protein [Candidatus Synoicihabitans sp.]